VAIVARGLARPNKGAIVAAGLGLADTIASLSGTGTLTISGTGNLVAKVLLGGTGTLTIDGTGALSVRTGLSGTGTLTISGTGDLIGGQTPVNPLDPSLFGYPNVRARFGFATVKLAGSITGPKISGTAKLELRRRIDPPPAIVVAQPPVVPPIPPPKAPVFREPKVDAQELRVSLLRELARAADHAAIAVSVRADLERWAFEASLTQSLMAELAASQVWAERQMVLRKQRANVLRAMEILDMMAVIDARRFREAELDMLND
jgi:hypothetical protein